MWKQCLGAVPKSFNGRKVILAPFWLKCWWHSQIKLQKMIEQSKPFSLSKLKRHQILSRSPLRPQCASYQSIAVVSVSRLDHMYQWVRWWWMSPACFSSFMKAPSPLCIWVEGFPPLDSPRFPRQPPLHLFSPHLHLTPRVLCHPPPCGENVQPRPASSQQPLGHGTIKNRAGAQWSCHAVSQIGTRACISAECEYWSPKKMIHCLLYLRSTFTVAHAHGSVSTPWKQCSLAGVIYLALQYSDSVWLC